MEESFHNIYVYQITTMYTLNILKFYMSNYTAVKLKIFRKTVALSQVKSYEQYFKDKYDLVHQEIDVPICCLASPWINVHIGNNLQKQITFSSILSLINSCTVCLFRCILQCYLANWLKRRTTDWNSEKQAFFFFFLFFFLAALGLLCCARAFSSCGEWGYSSLQCAGFSLWWLLLLWSTGSRCVGFRSCSM